MIRLLLILFVIISIVNIILIKRINESPILTIGQKKSYVVLIWLLPIVFALYILFKLMKETDN